MNEISYILAVDPGNEKTGIAIVSSAGELIYRNIIESIQLLTDVESIITQYHDIQHIVCGNGTNHKHLYPLLQQIGRNHKITTSLIDESHTTEEARKLYWQYNPPTGWRRCIPKGMQFPPEPVDDLTALVIGRRYTKQLDTHMSQSEESKLSLDELNQKRHEAIKRLYDKGDLHE